MNNGIIKCLSFIQRINFLTFKYLENIMKPLENILVVSLEQAVAAPFCSVRLVETDKSTMEVPSTIDGTIKEIRVKEGDIVPVGTILAIVE